MMSNSNFQLIETPPDEPRKAERHFQTRDTKLIGQSVGCLFRGLEGIDSDRIWLLNSSNAKELQRGTYLCHQEVTEVSKENEEHHIAVYGNPFDSHHGLPDSLDGTMQEPV